MKLWIWLAIGLASLAGATWWAVERSKPVVWVEVAGEGRAIDAVAGNVEVRAALQTLVKAERYGVVRSLISKPVDRVTLVNVGDVIAELDRSEVQARIELLEIQLKAAGDRLVSPSEFALQLERLNREQRELSSLGQVGSVPEAEIERIRAEIERLGILADQERERRRQQVILLESQLEQRRLEERQMTIVAPSAGVLDAVYVFAGDIVNPGTAVARIYSEQKLIEVSVREEDFVGVSNENAALVRFLAYPNETFSGEVVGLSPTADAQTRQRSVFISLEMRGFELVPGMTGPATLVKGERAATLIVPRRALVGPYVYVVRGNVVEVREVETGFVSLEAAEILSGLTAGELVIVDRPHRFRDGENVIPQQIVK